MGVVVKTHVLSSFSFSLLLFFLFTREYTRADEVYMWFIGAPKNTKEMISDVTRREFCAGGPAYENLWPRYPRQHVLTFSVIDKTLARYKSVK